MINGALMPPNFLWLVGQRVQRRRIKAKRWAPIIRSQISCYFLKEPKFNLPQVSDHAHQSGVGTIIFQILTSKEASIWVGDGTKITCHSVQTRPENQRFILALCLYGNTLYGHLLLSRLYSSSICFKSHLLANSMSTYERIRTLLLWSSFRITDLYWIVKLSHCN